ncbi:MAG TPA: DUF6603 domain-containing protein [Pyrinomonadaceae bacterium]|nr:DUF6603 domain-containing protein [Pyrinomonadaceae bacterium]
MAGEEIYIAKLGAWIARALGDTGGFATDLDTETIGFQMPDAIVTDSGVQAAGLALADAGNVLREGADQLDAAIASGDQGELVAALARLFEGLYLFVDATREIVNQIDARAATLPPAERDAVQVFGGLMARKVIDYLVISILDHQLPRLSFWLRVFGLIDRHVVEASGALNEPRYVRKELHLERAKDLFTDPAAHFINVYHWGTDDFDPHDILRSVLAFYREEASIKFGKVGNDAFLQSGPFRFSRDSSVSPPGMMLDVSAEIKQTFSERIEHSFNWGTDFVADLGFSGGVIFRLKPPFEFSVDPKTGTASGAFRFHVNRNAAARNFTIVGGNDLVRLLANDVGIGAELTVGASTTGIVNIDPGIFSELKGLTISLGSKDSDSFLASLLASADVQGTFDLGIGWKLSEGLVFKAAGGLEIAIPMHQNLGIASLETLFLILKIRNDGAFALEASAAITGHLGPLTATVDRMGVELTLAFVDGADAELGPLDLNLRFKPPSGVGLAVDAPAVRGGGFLRFDHEKGEYAGALELVFQNSLALKAIGLITTRMPDGSSGFSLIVIITAEFGTPIQLGLGFTLIGVGGLLGLNRTMRLEELAEGVRTGAVESVMFPDDVIANASQILSDMQRFFPPEQGTFLIGPMAKLGWGTPPLITATVGLLIEIPPGNIALLGVVKCVLPDEDRALLVLKVKFIGAFEVEKSRLWFFASLFESRVVFITIDGEMGLLIAFGNEPAFVLSVGGFHPKFNPPALPFPIPNRVSLSLLNESFARVRVEGYFAVTSNTAQFGAKVEIFFKLSFFSVEGHLGFDALFQFSPFYFIITFSASMSVKVFGVGLFSVRIRGQLEGTSPWHIEGEGSISLLFFDIDVPFSHTWGESADTVLPEIAALPILKTEFEKRENWIAMPPVGTPLSVSLRTIEPTQELVLHPLGEIRISQRAVPLDLTIQKIGNQKISDIQKAVIKVTASGLVQKREVREPFATAQFRELSEANKLSAPGYEKQIAGADVSVSGSDTRTSHAVKRIVFHELITIDNNYKEHVNNFFNTGKDYFSQQLASNATARSPLSQANKTARVPFTQTVTAEEPGFVIADLRDNSAWGGAPGFVSQAQAQDELASRIKTNPAMRGNFHVIPAAEVKAA